MLDYDESIERATGLVVEDALLQPTKEGYATLCVSNRHGFMHSVRDGTTPGRASEATIVSATALSQLGASVTDSVKKVTIQNDSERKAKLLKMIGKPDLPQSQSTQLMNFLADHHDVSVWRKESVERLTLFSWKLTQVTLLPRDSLSAGCPLLHDKKSQGN